MSNNIFIYGEISENGLFADVVIELLGVANNLAAKLENAKITVVSPYDFKGDFSKNIEQLKEYGCDQLIVVDDTCLSYYTTELFAPAVTAVIKEFAPSIVLIGATVQGRDLAPKISTALGTGLTADCTGLDINEKGQLAATRPTFGGNLMATILCSNMPQMATVRPNVFPKIKEEKNIQTELIKFNFDFSQIKNRVELCEIIPLPKLADVNLADAQIIVAGGRGMKTAEGFQLIEKLAKLIGGSPAASRGAVDMKIAPSTIQVGQTGKTVAPKIYIACGISGAIQHTVGMSSADVIIAINNNPKAKIFEIADYAIVEDAFEILPKWIELIEKSNG